MKKRSNSIKKEAGIRHAILQFEVPDRLEDSSEEEKRKSSGETSESSSEQSLSSSPAGGSPCFPKRLRKRSTTTDDKVHFSQGAPKFALLSKKINLNNAPP